MKRELKIDTLLAIVLALAPFGYENFDLPHSKIVGLVAGIVCLALVARVVWILTGRTNVPFKHASEFTWWRRQVIKHDIAGMREYLVGLDIPVPDSMPPLTVSDQNQGTHTPKQAYRGELIIPRAEARNRKIVSRIYMAYVMQFAVPAPRFPTFDFRDPADALRLFQAGFFWTGLRDYFHASYWNSIGEAPPPALVLWNIRTALGRKFADKLASRLLRVAVDSPQELLNPDLYLALTEALRIADSILEADQQSWPEIQKILDDTRGQAGDFKFKMSIANDPKASQKADEAIGNSIDTEPGKAPPPFGVKAGEPVPEVYPEDLKAIWEIARDLQARHPDQQVAVNRNLLEPAFKPGANIQATIYRGNLLRMVSILAPEQWATLTKDGQPSDSVFCAAANVAMRWPEVGILHQAPPFDVNEFLRLCVQFSDGTNASQSTAP